MNKTPMQDSSHQPLEFQSEDYVNQMAVLIDLKIPPEIRPSVIENFERIHAIARPVLEFDLADDIEPAPTFNP